MSVKSLSEIEAQKQSEKIKRLEEADANGPLPDDIKPGDLSGVKYSDEWSARPTDLGAIGHDGRQVGDRLELLKTVAGQRFREGKYTMACKMYTDAIRIAPQTHTLYSNRSAVYAAAGEYLRAFEDASKCVDLMPTWAKGYARKGAALHGMDRWREAIAAYEAGLRLEPQNAACSQGIEDAKKRHMLAGGDWKFIGNRKVTDDDGEELPFLGHPIYICAGPTGYFCYYDHKRTLIRVVNMAATYIKVTINADQEINRANLLCSNDVGGIACGKDHVWASDSMRCRVIQCSIVDGALTRSLGRSGSEDGNFDGPAGLALSEDGATLYVCDCNNHRIVALDANEMTFKFKFGGWGSGDGELIKPRGVATFRDRVLVADSSNQRLCLFAADGTFIRHLGPDAGAHMFAHEPRSVALTDGAAFCIEHRPVSDHKLKVKVPGRIHCIDPETGARLRPPFVPPFSNSPKGEGILTDVTVFGGTLYVTSGAGIVMALPREVPPEPPSGSGGARAPGSGGAAAAATQPVQPVPLT